ncbi:MAG: NUDIX hydrolase [Gammaproteobacteria bacterium]
MTKSTDRKQIAPPLPSASVIFVRDIDEQIEVLLVQRNAKIKFHGGAWVFPGGKVDDEDHQSAVGDDELSIAKAAAVREAQEEVGVEVDESVLNVFSHWLTPIQLPKRFSTWFFIAPLATKETIRIDASEIVDHIWVTPGDALKQQQQGELTLPGPTFVSLQKLQALSAATEIQPFLQSLGVEKFAPRVVENDHGRIALYHGDAGFEETNIDANGARHRLYMMKTGWRYEKDY